MFIVEAWKGAGISKIVGSFTRLEEAKSLLLKHVFAEEYCKLKDSKRNPAAPYIIYYDPKFGMIRYWLDGPDVWVREKLW